MKKVLRRKEKRKPDLGFKLLYIFCYKWSWKFSTLISCRRISMMVRQIDFSHFEIIFLTLLKRKLFSSNDAKNALYTNFSYDSTSMNYRRTYFTIDKFLMIINEQNSFLQTVHITIYFSPKTISLFIFTFYSNFKIIFFYQYHNVFFTFTMLVVLKLGT